VQKRNCFISQFDPNKWVAERGEAIV